MRVEWTGYSRSKRNPRLCVSLNKHGVFAINEYAHDHIYAPTIVNLFYSPARRCIGIKRCFLGDPGAFELHRRHGRRSGWVLRASRFMKHFGIEIEETIRFREPEETQDGMWIFDLTTAYVPDKVRRNYRNLEKTK
jgi:hypothetical protein